MPPEVIVWALCLISHHDTQFFASRWCVRIIRFCTRRCINLFWSLWRRIRILWSRPRCRINVLLAASGRRINVATSASPRCVIKLKSRLPVTWVVTSWRRRPEVKVWFNEITAPAVMRCFTVRSATTWSVTVFSIAVTLPCGLFLLSSENIKNIS